jgi:hypothetical protein
MRLVKLVLHEQYEHTEYKPRPPIHWHKISTTVGLVSETHADRRTWRLGVLQCIVYKFRDHSEGLSIDGP